MPASDPGPMLDQAERIASDDALREVAGQLSGLLAARQRAAAGEEAEAWRAERREVLTDLDRIDPGTGDVSEALARWGARLAELRRGAA